MRKCHLSCVNGSPKVSCGALAKGIPFLGFIPETVNFSDLELPSIGFTDEKIHAASYLPDNFLNGSANISTLPDYHSYENASMPNGLSRHSRSGRKFDNEHCLFISRG